MSFMVKLVVLLIVVLVATNYVGYQNISDISALDWVVSAKKTLNKIVNKDAAPEVGTVKVSTWTDAKGVVHYENRPISGAKTIEVDPHVNVFPSVPVVKLPAAADEKPKTKSGELRDIQEAKKAHFDALTQ
jgi:hypothetical protein